MKDDNYNLRLVAIFEFDEEKYKGIEGSHSQKLQEKLHDFLNKKDIVSGNTSVIMWGKSYCQIRIDIVRSKFDAGVPSLTDLILLDIYLKKRFKYGEWKYRHMVFHRREGH